MAKLSLWFLGPPQVTRNEQTVTTFKYDKVRALLAFLAIEAHHPHRREALTGLLWPDLPEATARNNLRQALSVLRDAVDDRVGATPFLLTSRETVQWNPASDYWLDVDAFGALLQACAHHPHRRPETCRSCASRLTEAVDLYRGDFLAHFFVPDSDSFDEWALLKREALRQDVSSALEQLARYHAWRGDYEQACKYTRRHVELDPWREEGHRQLMRLLLLAGERNAALAQYEQCRRSLLEGLGVEPEPETTALYERIRDDGDDAVAGLLERPPFAGQRESFPTHLTRFIGRERELAEIGRLLESPNCRLLTLAGPGGSGKTRLALQASMEYRDTFADGAVFIPLAPLNSAELLAPAIAAAVNHPWSDHDDAKARLLAHLRDKELLLVLDGFEHLLGGAELLAEILAAAPSITLMVTSRERLHLHGEWVFEVQGLPVPAEGQGDGPSTSAMTLFVESARRGRVGRVLSPLEIPHVAHICRLVDGMPLAIELAAGWTRLLPCDEIAHEISRSPDFLVASTRDLPERHRSLRAVFEHSWRLLSDAEQAVLRRLSVFRGGFSRNAAQQVAGASLTLLASLLDKWLVRQTASRRYDLHDLVRQYAYEKLVEAGEADQIQSAHLAFFVELAERAEPEFGTAAQVAWHERLEAELGNVRAAIEWSLTSRDAEPGLRLVGALTPFWQPRGFYAEARTWLRGLHALPLENVQPAVRARSLDAAAIASWRLGDYRAAEAFLHEALAIWRQLEEEWWIAWDLGTLAIVAGAQGNLVNARLHLEESLVIWSELNDERGIGRSHNALGELAREEGDYRRAEQHYREGLALSWKSENPEGLALADHNLGYVVLHKKQPQQAAALFQESLALYDQLGHRNGISMCFAGLAGVAAVVGQPLRAARLWGAAEALRSTIGAQVDPADYAEYERYAPLARNQAGDDAFLTAWAEGKAMTIEEAIAFARDESRS